MTGDEHYRQAEKALARKDESSVIERRTECIAEAQAHATLALAAWTADLVDRTPQPI